LVAARADEGGFNVVVSADEKHATVSLLSSGIVVASCEAPCRVDVPAGDYRVVTRSGSHQDSGHARIDGPSEVHVRTSDPALRVGGLAMAIIGEWGMYWTVLGAAVGGMSTGNPYCDSAYLGTPQYNCAQTGVSSDGFLAIGVGGGIILLATSIVGWKVFADSFPKVSTHRLGQSVSLTDFRVDLASTIGGAMFTGSWRF
jgi:hypothetical protein